MIDDWDLGRFTSFVGLFIMILLVVYHYAVAEDAPAHRNQ